MTCGFGHTFCLSQVNICALKPPPARLWLRQPAATTQTAPGAVLRGMEGGRGDFPYPKPENASEAVSGREGAKGRQGWGNKFPHAPVPTSPMGIPYPIPISSAVQGVVWRGEAPSFAPPPARGQGRGAATDDAQRPRPPGGAAERGQGCPLQDRRGTSSAVSPHLWPHFSHLATRRAAPRGSVSATARERRFGRCRHRPDRLGSAPSRASAGRRAARPSVLALGM